jgi:PTH1 family peptidyl-tRNA hydrolase
LKYEAFVFFAEQILPSPVMTHNSMKLIVWLGNPGREYENTRHNVGFLMIDVLREVLWFSDWVDSRFSGVVSEGSMNGEKILLLKPITYMNLSWESVSKVVNFYKINPKTDTLILVDDLDMDFAKVRYRSSGSAGGQNGIKSLIGQLGTDEFARLKVGIGRDARYAVSDWVLSRFKADELEILRLEVFPTIRQKVEEWLR